MHMRFSRIFRKGLVTPCVPLTLQCQCHSVHLSQNCLQPEIGWLCTFDLVVFKVILGHLVALNSQTGGRRV